LANVGSITYCAYLLSEVSGSFFRKPVGSNKMGPPDSPDLTCPFANATVSFCFTKLRVVPNQSFAVLAFGDAQTSLLGKQASRCGVCARRTQGNCPGFLITELLVSLSTALSGHFCLPECGFFSSSIVQKRKNIG